MTRLRPFSALARRRTGPPTPPTLSGLALWLRGDLGVDPGTSTPSGNAAHFTKASSQYLQTAAASSLNVSGQPFTAVCWVYFDSISGDVTALGNWTAQWQLYFDGAVAQFLMSGLTSVVGTSFGTLATGVWHMIAGGYDTAVNRSWLQVNDGARVTAVNSGTVPNVATPVLGVGSRGPGAGSFLDGRAARAGLWVGKSLSAAEVNTLFGHGSGLTYSALPAGLKTNLVSYWDLAEASGSRADSHGANPFSPVGSVGQVGGPFPGTAGVVSWADQSGAGCDFVQGLSALKPAADPAAFPSSAGVHFDGTAQTMLGLGNPVGLTGFYIAMVVKCDDAVADNVSVGQFALSDGSGEVICYLGKSGNAGISGFSPVFGYRTTGVLMGGNAAAFTGDLLSPGAVIQITHNGTGPTLPGNFRCRVNGRTVPLAIATVGTTSEAATQIGASSGTKYFKGSIGQVRVAGPVPLSAQLSDLVYLAARAGLTLAQTSVAACCGNSLTYGYIAATGLQSVNNYPATMQASLGSSWTVKNFGRNGATTEALSTDTPTVDPWFWPGNARNVCVIFEGVNSMANVPDTPAQAYAALTSYVQARQAAGWPVLACTMPDAVVPSGANILAYNALVLANAAGADRVLDLHADTAFGDHSNATWYQPDGIHLTDAGYVRLAALVQAVILTM